ncbi:MAG TPA: EamA family transporter [Longimicrobiales bacterium]
MAVRAEAVAACPGAVLPGAVDVSDRGWRDVVRGVWNLVVCRGVVSTRLAVVAAFATIYLVWGSTYLAIAYAVETMPPFMTMAARMLVAGGVLYGWSRLRGEAGLAREEWRWAAVTGALLFLGGYGALAWAEQHIASGTAALLGTTSPLWMVVIQWRQGGRRPGVRTWAGLALGTVGVALLLRGGGVTSHLLPSLAVLAAAFFWAVGSVRAARSPLKGSASRSAGAEMLAGGVVVLVAGLLLGEGGAVADAEFSTRSVGALAYLILFGSIAAFSAYRWLLCRTPPSLVATHSYVNPLVALLLGWMLAGEALGGGVLLAGGSIVGAVALLRSSHS